MIPRDEQRTTNSIALVWVLQMFLVLNQRLVHNHLLSFVSLLFWCLILCSLSEFVHRREERKSKHSASRWTYVRIRLLLYFILWFIYYLSDIKCNQRMPWLFTIKWIFAVCLVYASAHVERMKKCVQPAYLSLKRHLSNAPHENGNNDQSMKIERKTNQYIIIYGE